MAVALSEAQTERVRTLMHAGKFADETSVVAAALDLLERKQRLLAMVQEGVDAVDRGEVVEMDVAIREMRAYLETLPDDRE